MDNLDGRKLPEKAVESQGRRERMKVIGLIAIAVFILALAFIRFGKTIPWGAR